MSISNIKEIKNFFGSIGPQGPPNCTAFTNARCFGDFSLSNKDHDIKMGVCNTGGVVAQISKAQGGLGDGMSPTPAGRDKTQNALAGNANNKVPMVTMICNSDGTKLSLDSGPGRKATIQLATGDGKNGILITEGYIAIYTQQCYMVFDANRGVTFSNNFRVQEGPPEAPVPVQFKVHSA
jgi:hypothetical protein